MHIIALIIAAPTFVWGWGYVGLALVLGLAKDLKIRGRAMPTAVWKPWAAKHWDYSTTICRGIIVHPGTAHPDTVWDHEKVHVRQAEDLCLLGLVLGALSADVTMGLIIWLVSPFGLGLNYVMAGLRKGKLADYRSAEHEEAAYAQTEHDHERSTR